MPRSITMMWFGALVVCPFTAIITFIVTLFVCNGVQNSVSPQEKYPFISELGTNRAYYYFASGFIMLLPQVLLILIGRLQFLLQSQRIIRCTIIYIIHAFGFMACPFLLIMAIANVNDHPLAHDIGVNGLFLLIVTYCFLHTGLEFYLFSYRLKAPQHSNIIWPVWFLICSILVLIFFIIWKSYNLSIPQYFAAAMPFLYFLGFVPQFWIQARKIKLNQFVDMFTDFKLT
uniref:CWH43-like N-terminal domain-containing protein n=1 Tax=Adineta vaga TaxID=104782 RepID=G3KGV2_ADIVA|nr:hypothetical protein [Adineta vaga]